MTDEKSSFVLYAEYLEHIKLLTMEQRGALLTAVLCYASGDELPEMDGMTNMAFSFIKSRIDRDTAAYLEKIEKRREAGKLGGRPKTKDISQKQEKAKKANGFSEKQNNPVTDNVNVTVNVNDNNKILWRMPKRCSNVCGKYIRTKKAKDRYRIPKRNGYLQSGKIGLLKRLTATVLNCRRTPTGGKHSTGAHFLTVAM